MFDRLAAHATRVYSRYSVFLQKVLFHKKISNVYVNVKPSYVWDLAYWHLVLFVSQYSAKFLLWTGTVKTYEYVIRTHRTNFIELHFRWWRKEAKLLMANIRPWSCHKRLSHQNQKSIYCIGFGKVFGYMITRLCLEPWGRALQQCVLYLYWILGLLVLNIQ